MQDHLKIIRVVFGRIKYTKKVEVEGNLTMVFTIFPKSNVMYIETFPPFFKWEVYVQGALSWKCLYGREIIQGCYFILFDTDRKLSGQNTNNFATNKIE